MKLKVIIHEAEEGGYWAEVPSIPGWATWGETTFSTAAEAARKAIKRKKSEVRLTSKPPYAIQVRSR